MSKASHEQHREVFPGTARVWILGNRDAGAHPFLDASSKSRYEMTPGTSDFRCCKPERDRNPAIRPIRIEAHAGIQILLLAYRCSCAPRHKGKCPSDGLKINIVFEKNICDPTIRLQILRERRVFELDNVNSLLKNLAMDKPPYILNLKLAYRMRHNRCHLHVFGGRSNNQFNRGAKLRKTSRDWVLLSCGKSSMTTAWTSQSFDSSRKVSYINTAPPWIGGKIE